MNVQEAVKFVEAHLLGRMEDGTYVAPWVSFTAQEIRELLWEFHDKCICTPAIAGISDGPSVDCPKHGDGQGEPMPCCAHTRCPGGSLCCCIDEASEAQIRIQAQEALDQAWRFCRAMKREPGQPPVVRVIADLATAVHALLDKSSETSDAQTIQKLRDQIEEARNAWWSATEQGDNGLVYTDKIENAMDDIWSAIGDADWTPAPQGEPSDAQVEAAGEVLYGFSWGTYIADPDLVRAALRAALDKGVVS